MQSNSVAYIFGFCAFVCLTCSVIVSTAAVGLKERQEKNKLLDRQKKVLVVAGLMKEGELLSPAKIQSIFQKRIKPIVVDLRQGTLDSELSKKAGDFDQKKASKEPSTSRSAPKNLAGLLRLPLKGLVYLVSKKDMAAGGKGFSLSQYIFPVEGKGLWSTLYGFVALAPDFNEIRGLTFYQHAETPGLGGEVDNPSWKAKWPGRMAFGPKGSSPSSWKTPKIRVVKGIAGDPKKAPHSVDGLAGATITSNGVTHLLRFWLGSHGFGPYIKNQLKMAKAGGSKTTVVPANQPAKTPTLVPAARTVKTPPSILPKAEIKKPTPAAKPAARLAAPAKPAPAAKPAAPAQPTAAPTKPVAPSPAVPPAKPAPEKPKAPAPRVVAPTTMQAAPTSKQAAPAKAKPASQPAGGTK